MTVELYDTRVQTLEVSGQEILTKDKVSLRINLTATYQLLKAGITTTLSGGGCVAIWSEGKYVSRDLDFIEEGPVPRRKLKAALTDLGFVEKHRYFVHPDTEFFIEFPTGPLTVGDERVEKVAIRNTVAGRLRIRVSSVRLTPRPPNQSMTSGASKNLPKYRCVNFARTHLTLSRRKNHQVCHRFFHASPWTGIKRPTPSAPISDRA